MDTEKLARMQNAVRTGESISTHHAPPSACELAKLRIAVLTVSQGKSNPCRPRDTPMELMESSEYGIGNASKLKRWVWSGHTSARDGTWVVKLEALELVDVGSCTEAGKLCCDKKNGG